MCLFLMLILTASEQDLPLGGGLCIQLAWLAKQAPQAWVRAI